LKLVKLKHGQFFAGGNHINIDIFLTLLSKKTAPVTFIQIGANDGIKDDPIFSFVNTYKWKGILVEPLPDLFQKLVNNYRSERTLVFENVGISDRDGEMDFYSLPTEFDNPEWLQQIGTFDREAIEFNLVNFPELSKQIVSRKIHTITLAQLIARNGISKVDLLIIDAEGFEYRILTQLEQLVEKPAYILFEWGCMAKSIQENLFELLKRLKYNLYASGRDVLAVNKT
jgi:FkbM family methyltransferase